MPSATFKAFPELAAAAGRAQGGEIDYVFADGLGLSLWLERRGIRGIAATFAGGAYPGEPLLR